MAKGKVTAKSLRQGQTVYAVFMVFGSNGPEYYVQRIVCASKRWRLPEPGECFVDEQGKTNVEFMRNIFLHRLRDVRPDVYYSRRKAERQIRFRNYIEKGIHQ